MADNPIDKIYAKQKGEFPSRGSEMTGQPLTDVKSYKYIEASYIDYINNIIGSDYSPEEPVREITEEDLQFLSKDSSKKMYFFKVVIMGDGAVGKTALRQSFLGADMKRDYIPTLGAGLDISHSIGIGPTSVRFQIWDLAGQPQFSMIRGGYYGGANGALLVFDVSSRKSYEHIPLWINDLWKWNGKGPIPIVILGNKEDLRDEGDQGFVTIEEAKDLTAKINNETRTKMGFGVNFIPTSAITGLNVEKAFKQLAINVFSFQAFIEDFGLGPLFELWSLKKTGVGPGF